MPRQTPHSAWIRNSVLLLLFALAAAQSGCASIVSHSEYDVTIATQPPRAEVIVRNNVGTPIFRGKSPAYVPLKASDGFFSPADYNIEVRFPNGAQAQRRLGSSLDPWYFGNLLFGGLIGFLIVDPATGAMWKLPKQINISAPVDDVSPTALGSRSARTRPKTFEAAKTTTANSEAPGDALTPFE